MENFSWPLTRQEQEINISMDALKIIETYKGKELNEVPKCSLVNDCSPPDPPSQQLTRDQLLPLIKSYNIDTKEEAFHPELLEFCLTQPIVMIHGLTAALKINLDLFSTKTLIETNPNLRIEIREQTKYASDENWDIRQKKKSWKCFSDTSYMTISRYAKYQMNSILKSNEEIMHGSVYTSDRLDQVIKHKKNRILKFATNVDLSVAQKWKPQLDELTKLPPFLRVECDDNMLSYVGNNILGMNTVQLYMKVPGCKTPGHQENNNFCSVNINTGPGDCEWFAVPHEYWGVIHSLCEQNEINYLRDSWWPPDLDVLYKKNVPVYRFYQKAGDIVWVNVGCVHWVYAIGGCNNIAWNVGPFTARQYQLAIERYEWNKLKRHQSIVPMVQLSWNLARNAKVSNPQLFQLIKNCLLQTMIQNYLTLEFIKRKDVKVLYREQRENDRTSYCADCNLEIFNILICKKKKKKKKTRDILMIYCIDCALKQSPSLKEFICLEKCHMEKLMNIYDEFTCN